MRSAAWNPSNRPLSAARIACVAIAVVLVATMIVAFAVRVPFPYELEWMEGATLIHIERLARFDGIYESPTLAFVPFAYPPLYYVVCVPFAWVLGPSLAAPRLVSAAASLTVLAAIYVIVRHRAGPVQGAIACGLFAGAYRLSDAWLDLARVDALYLAWLALAWMHVTRAHAARSWALAGVFVWLAFLTKQPALLAVSPLCLFLVFTDRKALLWFAGTAGALAIVSFLVLDATSDGWFRYYVLALPRLRMRVSLDLERVVTFWTSDLLRHYPIALAVGVVGTLALKRHRDLCFAAGLLGTAWLARLEGGAWSNAVLPAYLAIAVLFGIALQRLGRWMLPMTVAAAFQLGMLLYDPRPFLPTTADRAAGAGLVEAIRALPGPVLFLGDSYWSTIAGLGEQAHGWAVTDVVWADRQKVGPKLEDELRTAIGEQRFGAIVMDGGGRSWFQTEVEASYGPAERLSRAAEYTPRSGAPRRPELVFRKRPSGTPGSGR